jgi:hypothetical protein
VLDLYTQSLAGYATAGSATGGHSQDLWSPSQPFGRIWGVKVGVFENDGKMVGK